MPLAWLSEHLALLPAPGALARAQQGEPPQLARQEHQVSPPELFSNEDAIVGGTKRTPRTEAYFSERPLNYAQAKDRALSALPPLNLALLAAAEVVHKSTARAAAVEAAAAAAAARSASSPSPSPSPVSGSTQPPAARMRSHAHFPLSRRTLTCPAEGLSSASPRSADGNAALLLHAASVVAQLSHQLAAPRRGSGNGSSPAHHLCQGAAKGTAIQSRTRQLCRSEPRGFQADEGSEEELRGEEEDEEQGEEDARRLLCKWGSAKQSGGNSLTWTPIASGGHADAVAYLRQASSGDTPRAAGGTLCSARGSAHGASGTALRQQRCRSGSCSSYTTACSSSSPSGRSPTAGLAGLVESLAGPVPLPRGSPSASSNGAPMPPRNAGGGGGGGRRRSRPERCMSETFETLSLGRRRPSERVDLRYTIQHAAIAAACETAAVRHRSQDGISPPGSPSHSPTITRWNSMLSKLASGGPQQGQ